METAVPEGRWAQLRRFGLAQRGKTREDAMSAAIARVVFPVMICMALSIYLVHSVGNTRRECGAPNRDGRRIIVPHPENDTSENTGSSVRNIIFVGAFTGFIILFTFVLVLLYKCNHTKIIFLWLFGSSLVIFCGMGGLYIFSWLRSRCFPIDWITLSFIVWNFSVSGLVAIFWKAPRIINQGYLIIMSALMAYIFRSLSDWVTWAILGILVVWDLFAVLAPCGPLKMLVETARERDDPLPALVYDTNPAAVGRDPTAQPVAVVPKTTNGEDAANNERRKKKRRRENPEQNGADPEAQRLMDAERGEASPADQASSAESGTAASASASRRRNRRRSPERAASTRTRQNGTRTHADGAARSGEEVKMGTLGAHLKLGLGDFVFYSVLVAQASKAGAMTAITSFVAILFGLCSTLLLVVVFRKALPALPISIVLGLVFHFLTRYTVQPFVENILPELLLH